VTVFLGWEIIFKKGNGVTFIGGLIECKQIKEQPFLMNFCEK